MRESGISMIELLVVMAVLGIVTGTASVYLAPAAEPVETGAVMLEGFFRVGRARAMGTISAVRIRPTGPDHIIAEVAGSCSASTWTAEPDLTLDLPREVTVDSGSWAVCFSGRGVADSHTVVTLSHPNGRTDQVEVVLGGSARIVP